MAADAKEIGDAMTPRWPKSNAPAKQNMKYHPMRRDLWTDPAVNTKSIEVWQEYSNNHPLSKRAIHVDRVAGQKNPVAYRDITASLDKYVNIVHDNWAGAGKAKKGKGKKVRRASSDSDEEEQEITITLQHCRWLCERNFNQALHLPSKLVYGLCRKMRHPPSLSAIFLQWQHLVLEFFGKKNG
jgi:hypothetical protein